MLDTIDRKFIEMVKRARSIRIVVNYGCDDELTLRFNEQKDDIHKLTHDVALAVQDFVNKVRK